MKLKKYHLLLLTVIGGILLGISFPFSFGAFPLAFIALVPILIVNFQLNQYEGRKFGWRFLFNYLHFVIFNLITTWWIYYASEGGMYMAVLANALLMVIPFMLIGQISKHLGENKALFAWVMAWLSFEYAHYHWELSWPWLSLGNTFGTEPALIQWYEYSGVLGGTFWILFVNAFMYILARNVWIKKESFKIQAPILVLLGLALFIPIISSLIIFYTYDEVENPVEVVVVQPNMDPYTEKFNTPLQDQLDIMFALNHEHSTPKTDVILWPETAIAYYMDEATITNDGVFLYVKSHFSELGIPMLVGGDTYRQFNHKNSIAAIERPSGWFRENYNTALMIDHNPLQFHHKSKLVLGPEKLPFMKYFPSLGKYAVSMGGTQSILGVDERPVTFTSGGIVYAPLVCYESVYGEFTSQMVLDGAQVICIITNDGWWRNTPGHKQHCSFAQIRAIENRRPVARSANTGISCVINQKGEIIEQLNWDERGAINQTVNANDELTFYTKYGDLYGRVAAFLFLTMLLYTLSTAVKNRKSLTNSSN